MAKSGPERLAKREGFLPSPCSDSGRRTAWNFLSGISGRMTKTRTATPTIPGTTPAPMTCESPAPRLSEAAMVFGFGDMMFPHLAPPVIATKIRGRETLFRATSISAIGATVMTAMSTKTPAQLRIIVESAMARYVFFSPRPRTMYPEREAAAPDLISAPLRTPAARILRTAGTMSLTPEVIAARVSVRLSPPRSPPTRAPSIIP